MITKKCRKCGKLFDVVNSQAYLCPECATMSRKDGVYRERVCSDCGATFWGFPRSKRCPECQRAVNLARKRDYNKRGPVRGLGSTDKCEKCGRDYIVESGMQRYCKDCAPEAVLNNTRARKRDYNASNPEIIEKARVQSRGNNVCAVCGGMIPAGAGSNTCSAECWMEQRRRVNQRAQGRSAMLDGLELDETADADIIERLTEVENISDYIKTAIRRDINRPEGALKVCAACGAEFEKRTNAKYCTACRATNAARKAYYRRNQEAIIARGKEYTEAHREEINSKHREYYHQNLDKVREIARKSAAKRRAEKAAQVEQDAQKEV